MATGDTVKAPYSMTQKDIAQHLDDIVGEKTSVEDPMEQKIVSQLRRKILSLGQSGEDIAQAQARLSSLQTERIGIEGAIGSLSTILTQAEDERRKADKEPEAPPNGATSKATPAAPSA